MGGAGYSPDRPLSVCPCSFMTPLHVAAERAHNDVLEVLQKHGAKVCVFTLCIYCLFVWVWSWSVAHLVWVLDQPLL